MKKQSRFLYFIIAIFVLTLGVFSRKVNGIPLFFGDILYAVMVYFGCRIIFISSNNVLKILLPLIFCYLIELQQLFKVSWLVEIRNTTLGHYALGQGFLWSDLVLYSVGVFMALLIDFKLIKSFINSRKDAKGTTNKTLRL